MLGAYERWCGVDDAMMTWLMVPEVMEALHIRMDKKATEKNNLNYQVNRLDPSSEPPSICVVFLLACEGLPQKLL